MGAEQLSLQALVTPSTVIQKDGNAITFALHGFIEFKSLGEMFSYIDSQDRRWRAEWRNDDARPCGHAGPVTAGSGEPVVSMVDERPLETLLTHTAEELRAALAT